MIRTFHPTLLLAAGLVLMILPLALPAAQSTALDQAINHPQRSSDTSNDERRQLRSIIEFSEVQPGHSVVELAPGAGYWTRVFSPLVGAEGRVHTIWPEEMARYSAESMARWQELAQGPHYANVKIHYQPAQTLNLPEQVDVVFTSQNYHDYNNLDIDMAAFLGSVFHALKPGGAFIIIDHSAPEGSGLEATDTTHRIDPEAVRAQLEAAGFVLEARSDALANPEDPRDVGVFDESIRGHTDQFIYRFVRPQAD